MAIRFNNQTGSTELSAEPERPRLPPSGTLQPDSGIVGAGARGKFELMSARATRTRDLKRQILRQSDQEAFRNLGRSRFARCCRKHSRSADFAAGGAFEIDGRFDENTHAGLWHICGRLAMKSSLNIRILLEYSPDIEWINFLLTVYVGRWPTPRYPLGTRAFYCGLQPLFRARRLSWSSSGWSSMR